MADAVKKAIVGIGTPEAATILVSQLRPPSTYVLRDIAALRENGRNAGQTVALLLRHHDWDIRVAAARTLGYINYDEASADLRRALASDENWQLVYTAAESLGRLKDQSAIPDLNAVAQRHWFPPVRRAASKAVRVIEGTDRYQSRWQPANFAFEYFEYVNAGMQDPDSAGGKEELPSFEVEKDVLSPDERKSLKYAVEVVGFDEKGKDVKAIEVSPRHAFRLGKDFLFGGDRGEWGGELAYQDRAGVVQVLIPENVHGIHRMPFGVVAMVGLAHLMLNSGCIYLVKADPDATTPIATRWQVLPGAPIQSGRLENGDLFISCYGGNVVVTPGGEIKMANAAGSKSSTWGSGK